MSPPSRILQDLGMVLRSRQVTSKRLQELATLKFQEPNWVG